MTEKQELLLQLFREVDAICKKHNLRYVMAGGTLIGVLRNEGFIPWDDDVDIYMPKSDWDKFVEICKTEMPDNRAIYCSDVDRTYTNSFPRYGSTDTCSIHKHQIIGDDKAGEIIDVLTPVSYTHLFWLSDRTGAGSLIILRTTARWFIWNGPRIFPAPN